MGESGTVDPDEEPGVLGLTGKAGVPGVAGP